MTANLRARVLEASIELIEDEGLAALSMREVARRAGVSHQAPYHHFEDKESIVAALVERGFVALAEKLEAHAGGARPARERLSKTGRAYVAFALDSPVHFRLMFRPELVDRSRFPAVEAAGAHAHAVLERLVDELCAGRQVSTAKKAALVSLHWSAVHGLATLMLDGALGRALGSRAEQDAHVAQVIKLLVANAW